MRHRAENNEHSPGTGSTGHPEGHADGHAEPATPPALRAAAPDDITDDITADIPDDNPDDNPADVPATARWRASLLPRILAVTVMTLAVLGTSTLGVRYAQSRSSDDFVSLLIGLVVVVVLWVMVILSTPRSVTLEHTILTVHTKGGSERFDLVDASQPVDLVGNPRTSHWAVLLHRAGNTTVVLRRNDVIATELDPIVRHYRAIADQRRSDPETRFNP